MRSATLSTTIIGLLVGVPALASGGANDLYANFGPALRASLAEPFGWAIAQNSGKPIILDGPANVSPVTFLADAGGHPGKPVGVGIQFRWEGPHFDANSVGDCVRFAIPLADALKIKSYAIPQTTTDSLLFVSSTGQAAVTNDRHYRRAITITYRPRTISFETDHACDTTRLADLTSVRDNVEEVVLLFHADKQADAFLKLLRRAKGASK